MALGLRPSGGDPRKIFAQPPIVQYMSKQNNDAAGSTQCKDVVPYISCQKGHRTSSPFCHLSHRWHVAVLFELDLGYPFAITPLNAIS